eukprot:1156198-Pelagomonas_calceolata.AAC.5
MTRLRLRVAERLKGAQNTSALLTTFNEIDMSSLMEMRSTYKVGDKIEVFLRQQHSVVSSAAYKQPSTGGTGCSQNAGLLELVAKYFPDWGAPLNVQLAGFAKADAFLEKHGVKLGFMSAFVKASAYALQEVPAVNGGE